MNQDQLNKICLFVNKLNKKEALNGDDIYDISEALKEFNGD